MKKQSSIIIVLLLVIITFNAISQDSGTGTSSGSTTPTLSFEDTLRDNPASAFENNAERAWNILENNPDMLTNQNMLEAAFEKDPARVAGIINGRVSLLSNPNVLEKFNEAVMGEGVILLNGNERARREWFWVKYKIYDRGNGVETYDGNVVKTKGEQSTSFTTSDFRDATINSDGSLSTTTGSRFKRTSKLYLDKSSNTIIMEGGFGEVPSHQRKISLQVSNGEVELKDKDAVEVRNRVYNYFEFVTKYKGDFKFSKTQLGDALEGNFERRTFIFDKNNNLEEYPISLKINGKIIVPESRAPGQISLVGDTRLESNGFSMQVKTKGATPIDYIETLGREKDFIQYCNSQRSCVINTPGEKGDSKFRDLLSFRNVQNGDQIRFETKSYFGKVSVDNLLDGQVNYVSLDSGGAVKNEIVVSNGANVAVRGQLAEANAGRFDVWYVENGKQMQQHWSSSAFQKEATYFDNSREHFVTCEPGNCEKAFAESFGRVIGPPGKVPLRTIIVTGDNADVAKNLEDNCKIVGCYILNSRDIPLQTTSKELVLTGHHWADTNYIWRDAPTVKDPRAEGHSPIDPLYFDEFPNGPVEKIAFSACNTVVNPSYPALEELKNRYANLNLIQGRNGIAPLYESLSNIPDRSEVGNYAQTTRDASGSPSYRMWWVKDSSGRWQITDGKNYFAALSS